MDTHRRREGVHDRRRRRRGAPTIGSCSFDTPSNAPRSPMRSAERIDRLCGVVVDPTGTLAGEVHGGWLDVNRVARAHGEARKGLLSVPRAAYARARVECAPAPNDRRYRAFGRAARRVLASS